MNQKIVAFAFASLMLVGAWPTVVATHTDGITPDLPRLPEAEPTQDCIGTSVDPEILVRVNQLVEGDPAWYTTPLGVPALCLEDEPIAAYQQLVLQLESLLDDLRYTTERVQRQVDDRAEATLPDSEYPNELVSPRTVLLDEGFNGLRKTGFGDWKVVGQGGDETLWKLTPVSDGNGTRNVYRFGDDDGYVRGAHQWLVSPEIDLTALKGDQLAVQDLAYARDYARGRMRFLCEDYNVPSPTPDNGLLSSICGGNSIDPSEQGLPTGFRGLSAIVEAYEAAFDDVVYEAPVMQHAAYLDLVYDLNMDRELDGVRMWVYTGDRQPDRAVLFDPKLGEGDADLACRHEAARIAGEPAYPAINDSLDPRETSNEAADLQCTYELEGGVVVTGERSSELRNMTPTEAFFTTAYASDTTAFSGDTGAFVKARINLTDFFGKRIWILFEAKTKPDLRAEDIFDDASRFPRREDFGFSVASMYVEGDGYLRNLRLKAIGATYDHVLANNDFGDGRDVRTTLPSGNDPVVAWVHNAGDYTENATLTVRAARADGGRERTHTVNLTIKPDTVLSVKIPWGNLTDPEGTPPVDGKLYRLNATLTVYDNDARLQSGLNPSRQLDEGTNVTSLPAADPNTTRVRPANAAGIAALNAGTLNVAQDVRVAQLLDLTPVRADGLSGTPIQVCSAVEARKCAEHFAGKKGEPRIVLVGVRNDGNAPQDVRVRLSAQLDGLSKDDIVLLGNERTLLDIRPGETRPVQFTVLPNDPGAYRLIFSMLREGEETASEPNVERQLYVQRSTGLLCLDTLDERECGPSFRGELVPALLGENVTAATFGGDGTLYVATRITEANETGRETGMLAARDTTGAWRTLANLSGTRLRDRFGDVDVLDATATYGPIRDIAVSPAGDVFLVGDDLTALRYNASGLSRITVHDDRANLTAALWHNGTLLAAGENGTFLELVENGTMVPFDVAWPFAVGESGAVGRGRYDGDVTDLEHDMLGAAIAVGTSGFVARHPATGALSADWTFVDLGIAGPRGNGTDLYAVDRIGNATWLAGAEKIMFNASGAPTKFVNLTIPPAVGLMPGATSDARAYAAVFRAMDGALYVMETDGTLATCRACDTADPEWEFPLLMTPAVAIPPAPKHLAQLTIALASETETLLLGEAGALLALARGGAYDNEREWTVVPTLVARDNGVIQTRRTETVLNGVEDTFIGLPDADGQAAAARASEFRLTMSHAIAAVKEGGVSPSQPGAYVRLLYRNVPAAFVGADQRVCPAAGDNESTPAQETVCYQELVRREVSRYWEPTKTAGWVDLAYGGLPVAVPANPAPGQGASANAFFVGLELAVREKTVRWAIDDIRLEGLVDGKWRTVVSWEGLEEPALGEDHRNGTWQQVNVDHTLDPATDPVEEQGAPDPTDPATDLTDGAATRVPAFEEWYWPFDEDPWTLWHVSPTYADEPVFAANNEFFPGNADPARPRLLSNVNSRLISPVIDLSEAYDPAISFRHMYSFRTKLGGSFDKPNLRPLDGGLLELQYELQGAECGARSDEVKCGWSPFYVVEPEGGYPTRATFGIQATPWAESNGNITQNIAVPNRAGEGRSYWGRLATPDVTGEIRAPRFTDGYEEQRVLLSDAVCSPAERAELERYTPGVDAPVVSCLPVNVTGRNVRFAFHLMTNGDRNSNYRTADGLFPASNADSSSRPGEGWYITDFKVLGARKLGVDLRASDLRYAVGYDVDTIGVGPGTRVPVNVTVENRGTFDVLGYTGVLEVRRVIDRARQISTVVDTITLTQQPVLPAEREGSQLHMRNHTLMWDVPAEEGAEYALTFTLVPIGVDEDEDAGDNVATLGTIARPTLASTVRQFRAELLVSPENATSDITRFMPMFVNNTGNVPLDGFSIERRITMIGETVADEADTCEEWQRYLARGQRTLIVDCKVWRTDVAAPAGTRSPVTLLSSEVSPSTDLFWKAPTRASYLASLAVETGTLASVSEKRIAAFATYLFDDIEGGPRGDALAGDWTFQDGWGVAQPGFRSSDAYGFGDASVGRYPADANVSLASPTIDLGAARTATLAFYQDFAFEASYDGGLVEASTDGGRTWTPLVPMASELLATYNTSYPMQPVSALHPDGVPGVDAYAFTSDSSLLPSSVDGWVLSQFDLAQLDEIAEVAAYESYGAAELSTYGGPALKATLDGARRGSNWCPGNDEVDRGCWGFESLSMNLTSPAPKSAGEDAGTMWWSGSPNKQDDLRRPIQNQLLEFPLDIGAIPADAVVTAEWWEFESRFAGASDARIGENASLVADGLYSYQTFHSNSEHAPVYRFNLGAPVIVDKDGRWVKMQADLTPIVRMARERDATSFKIGFTYAPLVEYDTEFGEAVNKGGDIGPTLAGAETEAGNGNGGGDYGAWVDDLGFAVDGFTVTTSTFVNGQRVGAPSVILDESTAWESRSVWDCLNGGTDVTTAPDNFWASANSAAPACVNTSASTGAWRVERTKSTAWQSDTEAAVGRVWSRVTRLEGAPAGWHARPVEDKEGFGTNAADLTPFRDRPYAFYSGDIGWDDEDTNKTLCRPASGDGVENMGCVEPGGEARLMTPVFDLGRVSGNNALLSFWHRYAFHLYNTNEGGVPLASGGVVEISEYVPQTGEWTEWKQIYSASDMSMGSDPNVASEFAGRGGYTAVTGNVSIGSDGVRRFDPPFANVVPSDRKDLVVQYLYAGDSRGMEANGTVRQDGAVDGWLYESFDVTEYIGKKVRFGFHYAFSPIQSSITDDAKLNKDSEAENGNDEKSGWWISDVKLEGNVLAGAPVELRFRAATDGNVDEGHWRFDDVGVYGSRYGSNVGVFVDETPGKFGAYNDTTATIPVTIRNLGSDVRRDLGVEIRPFFGAGRITGINLTAPGQAVSYGDDMLRIEGVTLPPGGSRTFDLKVKVPKDVAGQDKFDLVLELVESNPLFGYVPITKNEVAGILDRVVTLHLQTKPTIDLGLAKVEPAVPTLGAPVEMRVDVTNPGYGPAVLDVTCKAETLTGYEPHARAEAETPLVAGRYACDRTGGVLTLGPKESTELVFVATPTQAGYLKFEVKIGVLHGDERKVLGGIAVGVPAVSFTEDFARVDDALENFTGPTTSGVLWSYLRGNAAPGALLLGMNESVASFGFDASYQLAGCEGACRAVSPRVDLHNYSRQSPAFLSFWHLDRMAKNDGAQVRARVLQNEEAPSDPRSWSQPCVLFPATGYEGSIRQDNSGETPAEQDHNVVFDNTTTLYPDQPTSNSLSTPPDFFVTPNGAWQEQWEYALFDLSQPCQPLNATLQPQPTYLVGQIAEIWFEMYPGERTDGSMRRGRGQGIYVDDVTIGPLALDVSPKDGQRAVLLDNTTKGFHVEVRNLAASADLVRLQFDARNSSAPADSIRVPDQEIALAAGETKLVRVDATLPRDPSLLPTEFTARILARSAIDPTAVGATAVDLVFAPRQWAELGLAAQAPAGLVQEGTETFIPLTVENDGLVDSVDTVIRITDEWEGGPTPSGGCAEGETRTSNVHCIAVAGIPSYAQSPEDALRVFEFAWRPEAGSIGEHTLTFEIDPQRLGEEYTRSNNVVTLVVPVSELVVPDLVATGFDALGIRNAQGGVVSPAFDADVARYEVTAGELVSFEVKVANRGRAGATNVDVRALVGSLSLPSKQIPFIGPGSEAIVTFNWLAQKGEHQLEFLVRSEQVELSTANNRYPGVGVSILTVKGYEVAVEIAPPTALLEPGTEVKVPFRITNNGNAGEDLSLRATVPKGMQVKLPREGFFLRAGETYSDEARLILDAEAVAGEQFISIEAVARENPMKVAPGRAAVHVNATYAGSATGGIARGAPPTLTLPIELVNEGNSLEPWTVAVQLPAGWTTTATLPLKVSVPAHDRAVVELPVALPDGTAPGSRVVTVEAKMPNGEKRLATVNVDVLPLRAAGVTVLDGAPTPDRGALAVPITVENTGNVRQPFSLVLLDAPRGLELSVEPATFDLAPGATATATLRVKPSDTVEAGTYAVGGYTLFQGVVPETLEGRLNVQTLRVPVVRQDLVLSPLEYSPRAGVDAGDRVSVKVTVQNRGVGELVDLPVHLFVDDVFMDEVRIERLAPGGRADVTFNWTALVGVHTLTAVVDPYEDTVDADRADNAVSTLATVGVDAPTGGVAAGRADAPAPGLVGLVAALAVALFLTRIGSRRQRR